MLGAGDGNHDGHPSAKRAKRSAAAVAANLISGMGSAAAEVPTLAELEQLRGLIMPDFDVDSLTVDELRKELVARDMDKEGAKAVLCNRLKDAIAKGETPRKRKVRDGEKKQNKNKKQKRAARGREEKLGRRNGQKCVKCVNVLRSE
jgi:phosphopantothenate synthetase